MQRRSFFGVLGGLFGFLIGSKPLLAEEHPQTNLPVVQFDKNGIILNLEKLFENATCHAINPTLAEQIAGVYIRREDCLKLSSIDDVLYFGPMWISRPLRNGVPFTGRPQIFRTPDSIGIALPRKHWISLPSQSYSEKQLADYLVHRFPSEF